jgi:hypothetical protein
VLVVSDYNTLLIILHSVMLTSYWQVPFIAVKSSMFYCTSSAVLDLRQASGKAFRLNATYWWTSEKLRGAGNLYRATEQRHPDDQKPNNIPTEPEMICCKPEAQGN